MATTPSHATSDIQVPLPWQGGLPPSWRSRLKCGLIILALCGLVMPLLNRLTQHPGESVILLMPPALGAFLWFGWPRVRRIPWWKYAVYVAVLTPILAGAEYVVARMAQGRVLWVEVFWALYFTVAWRLAWTGWKLTVGRAGERWRRWGRYCRQGDTAGRRTGD